MNGINTTAKRRLALAVALALGTTSIGLLPAPAQAQASAAALEEITVTARRRAESLQDVPVAVSTFSGADLEKLGATDITVLQQTVPNLTLQVARGSNTTLIAFIRGVGQQDPLWGFEPGVGLYVDDVYIARPQGAVLELFDVERIEVLRGPQGTLYGRNSVGGAVKYVTKRLGDEAVVDTKITLGSYSQRDLSVKASIPLSNTLAFGGAVSSLNRAGFGKNLFTGADHYDKDILAYRAAFEWKPSDDLFFRIAADDLNDDSNARHGHREVAGSGLAAGETVLSNFYDTRAGLGNKNSVTTEGLSLLGEYKLNDQYMLRYIAAKREGRTDTLIDFDTAPAPALDVPAFYEDEQTTHELQLVYSGDRASAVAGVFLMDGTAAGAFDTIVGLVNLTTVTSGQVETDSFAAFADLSYQFNDQWSVSVGGRYTKDEKKGSVYRQNFTGIRSPLFGNSTAIPGLLRTNYTNSREFSEFTPRVSVSFEPSDAWTIYGSWGKGFKSGGFDMRGDAIFYADTVKGYDPEIVETTELGVKASLLDGRARINAAVFTSDYTDQQITSQFAIGTTVVSFVDNAGSSSIDGLELEGSILMGDNLTAAFQVGYIDAKFNEFITFDPATSTRRNLASQRAFQNTPEWTAALSLNWSQDLGNRGKLAIVPAISYRDDYQLFEVANPAIDQKSYSIVDLAATWTSNDDRWNVTAAGRNLTDKRYRIGGYVFVGPVFGNVQNAFYAPPRQYSVSIAYSFR
jgi:iron complex outermembrane receptor protein